LFLQYHGGTNFDRTSGGPFIATSYDYDAPIDEYGRPPWQFQFQYVTVNKRKKNVLELLQ